METPYSPKSRDLVFRTSDPSQTGRILLIRYPNSFGSPPTVEALVQRPDDTRELWPCFDISPLDPNDRPQDAAVLQRMEDADLVQPGRRFRHFKGAVYTVVCTAQSAGDCAPVVVYRSDTGKVWTRPLLDFLATVELEGSKIPRFELLEEEEAE